MKNAKVTKIIQHNKNQKTDQLYEPLREALRKSSVEKRNPSPPLAHVKASKISHTIRELSPEQATKMQQNIFIPANRKLIPAKHTEAIKGKTFSAVDVNVRIEQPITEEEFKEKYRNQRNVMNETVYEVSSKPSSEVEKKHYQGISLVPNVEVKEEGRNQASPIKLKSDNDVLFSTGEEMKKENDEPNIAHLNERYGSYSSKYTQNEKKQKPQYKYNLFSSLDEPINTKCATCWTPNEIIATKPNPQPWQ